MIMPMAVNAETCGGTTVQRCNASLIYSSFKTVYLARASTDFTLGLCVRQKHLDNGTYVVTYKSKTGILELETTQTVAPTKEPDQVNITVDASRSYIVQVRYADYGICFVVRYESDLFGCRLWVYENATTAQVKKCTDGYKLVCPGRSYDTLDEKECRKTA